MAKPLLRCAKLLLGVVFMVSFAQAQTQTIQDLYNRKNYKSLAVYENKTDSLSAKEIYMVGFAFFQLEDDEKAILLYDKAIAKGLNDAYIFFHKALAYRYAKKTEQALVEFDKAIKLDPKNQEYLTEKGLVYYHTDRFKEALAIFEQAQKLENTHQTAFYMTAQCYWALEKMDKTLQALYVAKEKIDKEHSYYFKTVADIARLEYVVNKNYAKSAEMYREAIALDPEDWELYTKYMKALNALGQYKEANAIFDKLQEALKEDKLPKEMLAANSSVATYEFETKKGKAVVFRSLVKPEKTLDITYNIYLLDPKTEKIVRKFMIEKTIEMKKDSPKFLLCERNLNDGSHSTYAYGFKEEIINPDLLQKVIADVINEKVKPAASSQYKK